MIYVDLLNIVEERSKMFDNKNEYYCSNEYKALFPLLKELYKAEGHEERRRVTIAAKKRLNKAIKEGQIETGFPIGLFF